ncbi:enoyl-CoA hydratase/isomerase family protein [Nocardia mexicana]|uniref:Enoyl-CoA hydratase/carnithine racemase n=1 Tax=Nocardia mexicana TaxID=279262 RepID=A0A370GPY0_9NOCA|nr:enoyl-CoA hydratase/isomerase family protein [Nocardia mexicana]RDI45370.1 enoyl-CoA hydratase/carnithine racemase [Nocardia mexicana]
MSRKPRTSFVEPEPFESYRKRFEDHFVMDRSDDGILEVRMHTDGGPAVWGLELHKAVGQMIETVGADRENQVLILTATGDEWLGQIDDESFGIIEDDRERFERDTYDLYYYDGLRLLEKLIWDIDIPSIGVLNGPGFHSEFPLLCDLTICADDTWLYDPHLAGGLVPGDGQLLVLQHLLGPKRANYAAYMLEQIGAQQLLDWGVVNEVHPRADLMPRAREIAARMLAIDPTVRRISNHILKRPWRRALTDDLEFHLAHELWGVMVHRPKHESSTLRELQDGAKPHPGGTE